VKNFFLLALLVITQVLGDMWLSRAMKSFGEANPLSVSGFATLVLYALTNYWIWLGVGTLILSLFLYFISVSRMDLSYVLPIHAFQYVLNAFFAGIILGERVSIIRWLSAIAITVGVLMVSISANPDSFARSTEKVSRLPWRRWFDRFFFFLIPIDLSAAKFWLTVLVIALSDSMGDLSSTIGMRQIGAIKINSLPSLLTLIQKILTNASILRGVCFQTIAFFSFLSILSWADISLVRPATASGYVTTLLGAKFLLHEQIQPGRLFGIAIVGIGVALVSLDGLI
jgi:drug/metabolite transporter (DMT)-like permease